MAAQSELTCLPQPAPPSEIMVSPKAGGLQAGKSIGGRERREAGGRKPEANEISWALNAGPGNAERFTLKRAEGSASGPARQ